MRRFSQRSALVTLSEINITPLLDLAFVLLIIFVITTPLLEQALPLKLPSGGQPDKPPDKRHIRTVEISAQGAFILDRRKVSLDQLEADLDRDHKSDPDLVINLRADEASRWKDISAVLDRCQRHGITRISPRFEPPKPK
jgi:biopolymer transport protein ExbD